MRFGEAFQVRAFNLRIPTGLRKRPIYQQHHSISGYCEQSDLHNPSMTVHESLIFAARMRLRPFSLADDKKVAFANIIMNLLELDEFADMLVGDEASGEGLPKHARKRLTVGVELAANPSILFADEPTSGLDSLSAALVVKSLRKAATIQGLTVVCTVSLHVSCFSSLCFL